MIFYNMMYMYLTFEAGWRIYASVDEAIIGSDNGISSIRRPAIIWTNVDSLLIGTLQTNFL